MQKTFETTIWRGKHAGQIGVRLGRRHIDNVVVALDSPLAEALLLEPSWREVDVGDDVVAFRKRDQLCFAHGDKHEIVNANVTWPERARYYHPLEIGRD
jgi:hypothetical protein